MWLHIGWVCCQGKEHHAAGGNEVVVTLNILPCSAKDTPLAHRLQERTGANDTAFHPGQHVALGHTRLAAHTEDEPRLAPRGLKGETEHALVVLKRISAVVFMNALVEGPENELLCRSIRGTEVIVVIWTERWWDQACAHAGHLPHNATQGEIQMIGMGHTRC